MDVRRMLDSNVIVQIKYIQIHLATSKQIIK